MNCVCSVSGEYCLEFLAPLQSSFSYSWFYDPIIIFFPSVLVKGSSGSHYTQILISGLSLFLGKSRSHHRYMLVKISYPTKQGMGFLASVPLTQFNAGSVQCGLWRLYEFLGVCVCVRSRVGEREDFRRLEGRLHSQSMMDSSCGTVEINANRSTQRIINKVRGEVEKLSCLC